LAYFTVKNPKFEPFLRASEVFEGLRSFWGPQKQKRKNNHNFIIFGAKNKIRMNFL
jgi:hypothetical protein